MPEMGENSKRELARKRIADQKSAHTLLALKREAEQKAAAASKKSRSERDGGYTTPDAKRLPTEEDKKGWLLAAKYVPVPKIPGAKEPCGAFYRHGTHCHKMLKTGKCTRNHTPFESLPAASKQIWCEHVNKTDGLDFNPETVTSFKKEGDKWVPA